MAEQRLLVIDIQPKSNNSATTAGAQNHPDRAEKRLWIRSDNTFKFNFLAEDSPAPHQETSSSGGELPAYKSTGLTSFTGQGSGFAFNFQIPPLTPEDMKTVNVPPGSENGVGEEKPPNAEQLSSPSEPPTPSKPKKKKKAGKKSTEAQQKPSSSEGSRGEEDPILTAEQQLKRELDWCIEQLEFGLSTQKGTPRQKEEASRALKTLRSSKAPLAKKRQVMRATTGEYRKKMEEEKDKQFKLIKSAIASAQVKPVSNSSKKSVFHRRAEIKTQTPNTEEENGNLQTQAQAPNASAPPPTQDETSTFVFTPSEEEFCFNFVRRSSFSHLRNVVPWSLDV